MCLGWFSNKTTEKLKKNIHIDKVSCKEIIQKDNDVNGEK